MLVEQNQIRTIFGISRSRKSKYVSFENRGCNDKNKRKGVECLGVVENITHVIPEKHAFNRM